MDEVKPPLPETIAMRNLDLATRDESIATSENVADLRPVLEFNARQRQLAESYKKPKAPDPTGPSFA